MADQDTPNTPNEQAQMDEQAQQQTGQRQVRLRIDDRDQTTTYANAFRTNGTAEELMIDFGMNMVANAQNSGESEILFKSDNRIVMNYYSANRLALTLSQLIRRHEQRFGELVLNVADRVQGDDQPK